VHWKMVEEDEAIVRAVRILQRARQCNAAVSAADDTIAFLFVKQRNGALWSDVVAAPICTVNGSVESMVTTRVLFGVAA
jgi:hypothetical protein